MHRVGVTDVKQLLRDEFPGEEFRSPGKTLNSSHIRRVRDALPAFLAGRAKRQLDVPAVVPETRAIPASVADAAAAPRSATARTPRAGGHYRVLLHRDVLEFLDEPREDVRIKARVKRLLREVFVDGRAQRRVKGTRGANAGWLRAPMGDNGGFHFYLWHALRGQHPVKHLELAQGEVVVRAILDHDATKKLAVAAGSRDDYTLLDAQEYMELIEGGSDADPLSTAQRKAFESEADVTITKGHPGAGKTTLQLERARRHEGRLLFVTFGASQRDQAARWFETLSSDALAVETRTHEDLFRELDPEWKASPPLDEAVRLLDEFLEGEATRLGPWRRHPLALYAELRAHYWGRALPISFRERAAVVDDVTRNKSYIDRRRDILGPAGAEAAAYAARALTAEQRSLLFGDLERVCQIANRFRLRTLPLPASLRSLNGVLVDEVQDLTVVEALVCIFVGHATARESGQRPSFHAAGDEAQTVRATDFEWGELKDLVKQFLGSPTDFELPGNVRSPKTLTQVINNSWALYKAFDKTLRPRGSAVAEVDEAAEGHVFWVDASSAEGLSEVLTIVARTPGAALVYPGFAVPTDVRAAAALAGNALVLSASEAKGLDFRVVFGLDVGRQAQEVWSSGSRARIGEAAIIDMENRITTDSIRVAISRSTEVLVLVERTRDRAVRHRLHDLCSSGGSLLEGVVTDVSTGELEAKLDFDPPDRTELVTQILAAFDQTVSDNLPAALQMASQARQWLGDSKRAGSVQGQLRKEVYRANGRALLRTAIASLGDDSERREQFRRANAELNLAGEDSNLARLALDARDVLLGRIGETAITQPLERITELFNEATDGVEASEALAVLLGFIAKAEATSLDDFQVRARILDAFEAVRPAEGALISLRATRRDIATRVAEVCLAGETGIASTKLAARALSAVETPRPDLVARLAEREGRFTDAIAIYTSAHLPADALRVSRAVGDDPRRSASLAKEAASDAATLLEQLGRVESELTALDPSLLTDAEREHLVRLMRDRFGKKKT